MKLPEVGVKQPVFTTIVFVVILVLGGISYYFLPVDIMPPIERPAVSIITPYLGVSAEDIETSVTKKIENTVNSISNVDKITSVTKDNMSLVTLEFKWGTNLDEAMNDVRTNLEFAKRELPDDIEPPQIFKFNTAQWPVIFYCIMADKSWPNLRTLVDKKVSDAIKIVPGVGTVRTIAGLTRQINVDLDLNRLIAYNIPITQIDQAIAYDNVTVTAGKMDMGAKTFPVRLPGEFEYPASINDVVIGAGSEGQPVKIRDVGRVTDGFAEQGERVFVNNKPAVLLFVMKQSGGNTVEVVGSVKKKMAEIVKTLPPDVKVVELYDMSLFIKDALSNLKSAIYEGGFLVVLITYLFLRRWRSSFVIAAMIPFSLIIAFVFLYLFGYTINIMSLASLAITIGMVVDTAIVILDNITRHMEEGQSLHKACVDGTNEVGMAVTSSIFTNVVVFVPLVFISGLSGVLFKQLGFAITVTNFGSLIAGLWFAPMIASKLLAKDAAKGFKTDAGKLGLFRRTQNGYGRVIGWSLKHRAIVIVIAILSFALSALLLFATRVEFMPPEDTGDFRAMIELTPGANVDESVKVGLQALDLTMKNIVGTNGKREYDNIYMRTGQSVTGFASASGEKEGDHVIELGGRLTSRKTRTISASDYADKLRNLIPKISGVAKFEINAGNPMQMFFGGGKQIEVEISGDSIPITNAYARKLKDNFVKKIPGLADLTLSRDPGRPNISLKVNKERASLLGLNTGMIALQLRNSLYGNVASKFRVEEDEYDIFVRLQESDRLRIEQLGEIPIVNLMGKSVPLKNVATIDRDITPTEIERLNQQRVIKVEGNVAPGVALRDIETAIKTQIRNTPPPPLVNVKLGGDIERMADAFTQLGFVAILGALLVYMVMAAQFENYLDPLLIMFSVPFALTGVFLTIVITGTTFSMYSLLGIIMLLGVVVNNAIVYVDYANQLRRKGMSMEDALVLAGKHRLRPILMTTLTTLLGMLPMAMSRAEGAELWKPIGISFVGGMTVSTLITLILIPTIYHLIYTWLLKHGRGMREEIVID